MPIWFWLNIPACVVVFSAVVGIPLWLVFRRPDAAPHYPRAEATSQSQSPAERSEHGRDREPELTH
jgi:hypothetical protein